MVEPSRVATLTQGFADRAWAIERIDSWLDAFHSRPVMLVTGKPGSGKSSLLLQFLARLEVVGGPRVLATVLRHPRIDDSFDASRLLAQILDGLPPGDADDPAVAGLPVPAIEIENVSQQVGSAERVTAVAVTVKAGALSTLGGLLPQAERRIRAMPRDERVLIVVDALDQAEDEGAEEFLRILDTLTGAAQGTGVRFLCTSRRRDSLWLAHSRMTTLDLVDDAVDLDGELRRYLSGRFDPLSGEERERLVETLVSGAQGNWLWATTNAAAVEVEIAKTGSVPKPIRFSEGLTGLYDDGIRRIQQRVGRPVWQSKVRPLLGAVACSFSGGLGPTELRWVTSLDDADIDSLVEVCHPFVEADTRRRVRLFHPDFGRWLLAGNIAGISEATEHLKLATGLTRLGVSTQWDAVTVEYAAPWVLSHWFSLFLLDPFHPDSETHEVEVERILGEARWADRAGPILETVEQAGRIIPRLTLPGLTFTLSAGLRALNAADAVQRYVGAQLSTDFSASEVDLHASLPGDERKAWMEQRLPDYRALVSRAVWGGLLSGYFSLAETAGRLEAKLTPRCVLDVLAKGASWPSPRNFEAAVGALCREIRPDLREELIASLRRLVADRGVSRVIHRAAYTCIAYAYQDRAATRTEEEADLKAADLNEALDAFVSAWRLIQPDGEGLLGGAINVANTLRELTERTAEQLDLWVESQAEIRDLRRAAGDPEWPNSANLLGDAYAARSLDSEDDEARVSDLRLAVESYLQAWHAAPPDHTFRLNFAIDVANSIPELPEPTPEQLDLLVETQAEVRDRRFAEDDPKWPLAANLLGDAYAARARGRSDEDEARTTDLGLALAAYLEAWRAATEDDKHRLDYAIDVANSIRDLAEPTAEQLDLLVAAQTDVRDRRRAADDGQDWVLSANLLGDAYAVRAASHADDKAARVADLGHALDAYLEAWQAAPPDHEHRLLYAINVANTVPDLPDATPEQLDHLVVSQAEVRDRRRAADDLEWQLAGALLADAYLYRAGSTLDEDTKIGDLVDALDAAVEAWTAAGESDDDRYRLDCAVSVANALFATPDRTPDQLDLLVTVQSEVRDRRRASDDPRWLLAAALLGDAYRARAATRDDDAPRDADLEAALEASLEAWHAVPLGSEYRLDSAIAVANALLTMSERTPEQQDLWVETQTEIRDLRHAADDWEWLASANLLGDAYAARARGHADDEAARLADLGRALDAYLEAWRSAAPDDPRRLEFAIDVANTIPDLPEPAPEQLDLLIEAQAEVRDRRRAGGDEELPLSADLLGDAYSARARSRTDDEVGRVADLGRALEAYLEAWRAAAEDDDRRLIYAIDAANAIRELPSPAAEQLDLLIEAQTEVRDRRRAADDRRWLLSANLLGDAFGARSASRQDDEATRVADLSLALDAYLEAWQASRPDDEHRLDFAIDVANTIPDLPAPTAEQLDLLVETQTVIRDLRREAADPEWPISANLLGDAYASRAESRSDAAARVADLAEAVKAYDEALASTTTDHPRRLDFAIDAANTRVVYAALARQNGMAALNEAVGLVVAEVSRGPEDYMKLRRLLPVLLARLRRHEWWSYAGTGY